MLGISEGVQVGRKNTYFGIGLFVLLGIVIGVPLTLNFFGVEVLTDDQYAIWKVVHGYGIFLGFINYFLGLLIDKINVTLQQKEIASWAFILAGVFGGVVRGNFVLLSSFEDYGLYASLGEVAFITVGTAIFLIGQTRKKELVNP